jgi:hypothetical protein
MIPLPSVTFAPSVNVNRKEKEQPATEKNANELAFMLMAIALILMSGAVLALSGALLVHAAKS